MIPAGYAPPPTALGPRTVVAAEVLSVTGQLTFDVAARQALADVTMVFTAGPAGANGPAPGPGPGPALGPGRRLELRPGPGPALGPGRRLELRPGPGPAQALALRPGPAPAPAPAPAPGPGLPEAVHAAFDLRQPLNGGQLDGDAVPEGALARVDLGGGVGAGMRLVGPLEPGSRHALSLHYELATPDVAEPLNVQWTEGGTRFDVWCSDLYPGRYLEQWLPVGLCQDRFALTLDVGILGARTEHRIVANAAVERTGDHGWRLTWPETHTSLSSLLLLAPAAEMEVATIVARTSSSAAGSGVTVEVTMSAGAGTPAAEKGSGPERPSGRNKRSGGAGGGTRTGRTARARGADGEAEMANVAELAELVAGWLEENASSIGPYVHGPRFVAHAWAHERGMEYDGATTGSVAALEHEVFHSWFGRGVKPGSANDGWIDEAYTTWSTSSRPDVPRLAATPLPLDLDPVVLDPSHPWSRHTPIESYRTGYRLFAGLASAAGTGGAAGISGTERVREAMASYYRERAGGFMTTDSLQDHLSEALAVDVSPWWDRYVRGRA